MALLGVAGAEPGDMLQIDIVDIQPGDAWGYSGIYPLAGTLPAEFVEVRRTHTMIDRTRGDKHPTWGK